ncbi:MAG: DAK2 domain-containing protein [Lachnospiraceae bacterium]|nr:DAK2 domain-containing protein [Lachnospiraceae bacterium]
MDINTIDAQALSRMFLAGAKALEAKKALINELNVFPVPDGDTGTNMTLTIMSAAKEVVSLPEVKMDTLSKAMSSGSLRGARGNSGVILSQLIRGFTKVVKSEEQLDRTILANAMQKATESAYKAVMKPKEGTILTVAKGAAEKAAELSKTEGDLSTFMEEIIRHAEYVLSQTPEMLPVLKQAGVVDSGGQGLVEIFKGAYDCLCGKELDLTIGEETEAEEEPEEETPKFAYIVRFTDKITDVFNAKNEEDFKTYLNSLGEELSYESKDGIVRVSLHTNDPGLVLQKGLKYGILAEVSVENTAPVDLTPDPSFGELSKKEAKKAEKEAKKAEKAAKKEAKKEGEKEAEEPSIEYTEEPKEEERPVFTEPPKNIGFITVCAGDGLTEIFEGLGADYVISGGQTMNPSTEDMLYAIDRVNAENIFILPNNKNIIMAANQAKLMSDEKNIIVIPTKTVPQGITALINYSMDAGASENEQLINEGIARVKTGQVTYAIRDTIISDMEIKQGNIIGIGDHDILSVGESVEKTALEMLQKMVDEESELISIYYGIQVEEEAANAFGKEVEERFPDCDVELHFGGQPVYYYITSVE